MQAAPRCFPRPGAGPALRERARQPLFFSTSADERINFPNAAFRILAWRSFEVSKHGGRGHADIAEIHRLLRTLTTARSFAANGARETPRQLPGRAWIALPYITAVRRAGDFHRNFPLRDMAGMTWLPSSWAILSFSSPPRCPRRSPQGSSKFSKSAAPAWPGVVNFLSLAPARRFAMPSSGPPKTRPSSAFYRNRKRGAPHIKPAPLPSASNPASVGLNGRFLVKGLKDAIGVDAWILTC